MRTEIWRTPIVNGEPYENYQVSNFGKILSLNYKNTGKAKLMNPSTNTDGYLKVNLWKNRKRKTCLVHRLVVETFLENPENKPQVNHKDEDKTNNFVFLNEDGSVDKEKSNLEWKNHRDNCNHGTRNERVAKAQSKPVLQFTLDGEFVREWPSIHECGRNGFDFRNVSACCRGRIKSAYGYIWKYKETL